MLQALMACLGLELGMVGADESTELWRHPAIAQTYLYSFN